MVKKPGLPARGSKTGRPIMVLLDVLGQRWMLRIIWELREGPLTFRDLRSQCDDVSPTVLNQRLKTLRELELVDHEGGGYCFTPSGLDLSRRIAKLDSWATAWAEKF
jgi:DNA-binding HxlR family transcriptional regulator